MPRDLVAGTDLETPRLITEGTYQVLERIGHPAIVCSEELTARMPTAREAELLRPNVPVVSVLRLTRDKEGRVLQALRIVTAADRNVFVYEDLPISKERKRSSITKS